MAGLVPADDVLLSLIGSHLPNAGSAGWRGQASCRYSDPNLFFPPGTSGDAEAQVEAAKAVCRSCPVQLPCLQFPLATSQVDGIWGGKDEAERRKLRRKWRRGKRSLASPISQRGLVAALGSAETSSEMHVDRRNVDDSAPVANVNGRCAP